jgi:hypothetical protein
MRISHRLLLFAVVSGLTLAVLLSHASLVFAGTVVAINPSKDNTLYKNDTGSISNGQGEIFVGLNKNADQFRRGLVAFDVAAVVPAGALIESVTLRLYGDRVNNNVGGRIIQLRRVSADWGEGASSTNDGDGVPAQTGDATWLYRFYNQGLLWNSPGGDFSSVVSASQTIGQEGYYTWGSTAQMVADVRGWLANPTSNFGWLLLGDETQRSSKRFDSGEVATVEQRPLLAITYSLVPEPATIALLVGVGIALLAVRCRGRN